MGGDSLAREDSLGREPTVGELPGWLMESGLPIPVMPRLLSLALPAASPLTWRPAHDSHNHLNSKWEKLV